jgi:hypothetical protein
MSSRNYGKEGSIYFWISMICFGSILYPFFQLTLWAIDPTGNLPAGKIITILFFTLGGIFFQYQYVKTRELEMQEMQEIIGAFHRYPLETSFYEKFTEAIDKLVQIFFLVILSTVVQLGFMLFATLWALFNLLTHQYLLMTLHLIVGMIWLWSYKVKERLVVMRDKRREEFNELWKDWTE